MEDYDDMMDGGSPFEQDSKQEFYRQEYEKHIKKLIYKEIKDKPDNFVNNEHIPNRVNLIKGLIRFYEDNLEYEKCGFLLKLQNIIKEKDEVIKEIIINEPYREYNIFENKINKYVNDYRIEEGLNILILSNIISNIAEKYNKNLINEGEISHVGFSERYIILNDIFNIQSMGENIGYGYASPEALFLAWIKNSSHNRVIVNKNFNYFGISVIKDSLGRNYILQIFIEK